MLRFVPLVLFILPTLVAHAAAPPDEKATALTAQVRQLEKEIEKVRGLNFKKPVEFQIIPRPKDQSGNLQGYYDTKKKALFIFDDIKDNYQKGVLIHEMVHALQDQHFGLAKLHAATYGTDAELALAALVEGDAQLTMIEVLKISPAIQARMLNTKLDKSKNLQNAFLYGVGTVYAQELKKKGGWRLVNDRYHFPPTSTAAVLHPEQRITPINLGPGKRIGEFGIIKLFHANPATQAECMTSASGWRGDRLIEDHGGQVWVVAFANPEQAGTFRKTLVKLRKAEYPKLQMVTEGDSTRWQGPKNQRIIEQRGARVVEITAPDDKAKTALVDRAFGPLKLEVYSAAEKKMLTFGEFTDRLLQGDVICVGESHDDESHHRAQLAVIKALYARDDRLGVGMEMFQAIHQKSLDRYGRGAIDERTMLEDSEYKKRWGYDWALYKPIVDFAQRNQIPVAALNVSNELRDRVRKVGVEKLTADEKKELGDTDFNVKKHRDYWFEKLGKMHGHGELSSEQKERFYRSMVIWDEYMANSAVKFLKDRNLRRIVVLAGSGHIDRNLGIPDRAAKRGAKPISVNIQVGGDLEKMKKDPPADFVLIVR